MKPFLLSLLTALWLVSSALASEDPNLYLEDAHGARAMEWVQAENLKTANVLEKDPHYAQLFSEALTIVQAQDRIPYPTFVAGQIFNFWQGIGHVRGYWRKTTLDSYRTATPQWTSVLDIDQLAANEKANWFWESVNLLEPSEERGLVSLSDGGEDAVTIREFDIAQSHFVDGGFVLPRGKQRAAWENADSIIAAREWSPGELTASGYPYVVKRLRRGQSLSAAEEIYRGSPKDEGGVELETLHDGAGHQAEIVVRAMTFFSTQHFLVEGSRLKHLALPPKASLENLVDGALIVKLNEEWKTSAADCPSGSLVAIDLAAASANPDHLNPAVIYAPGPRQSLNGDNVTSDRLVISTLDNVRGRAWLYSHAPGGAWTPQRLDLPDNVAIDLDDMDVHSNRGFIDVTGFLQPTSVWLMDGDSGAVALVKSSPARFDASHDATDQFEAVSKDGTRIPYFVVHPKGMALDGSHPTILEAYGGFQVSETPYYSSITGKLWLERGGVYVLANIRGGGEFGPAWHEAGLKTHRQVVYDDFAAVGEDLIARGITRPRRLGIEGGSNGGLLMGVEFNQHPELWHAVDIQVPLLDMERYEQIAAGASWVGEYGTMSKPDEAAFLRQISPYANIRRGEHYPEPFIWTTTKDDRVGPQHARKFAARLGEYGIPYFFYEVIEGGHAFGANQRERAHTITLEMTYFTRELME
ncbi:MAG TPA: prolyl oligopeptidase family serine peptidase [Opitutaceae bacterium]|jgi:prolyl oligopeptidase